MLRDDLLLEVGKNLAPLLDWGLLHAVEEAAQVPMQKLECL